MPQSSSNFSSSSTLNIPSMTGTSLTVPSPLTSIPSFDNNGLDPAQASLSRLQQIISALGSILRLPSTPQAFGVYLLGLGIVFVGAFLHVLVAAQIMQAEWQLAQLQEEYRALEQQNGDIIFQIARDSNMARLHERVQALGYVPVQEHEYVMKPQELHAATTPAPLETAQSEALAAADEAPAASAPVTTSPVNLGGQVNSWEIFWRNTLGWRYQEAAALPAATTSSVATSAPTSHSDTNFWAVWWEQARQQGSKLLDQLPFNGFRTDGLRTE